MVKPVVSHVSADALLDIVRNRRTYYPLSKDLGSLTPARIREIVNQTVLHVPTSFNTQTTRAVVLFGAEHEKLWDITRDALKQISHDDDKWEATAKKMAMFRAAAGTIMFFEDQGPVRKISEQFPSFASSFPGFAAQSDGMAQYTLWLALEAEGAGANLQHYSPLIQQKVAETWDLPEDWTLNAQMVFGGRTGDAGPKEFQPIEERVRVYGAKNIAAA